MSAKSNLLVVAALGAAAAVVGGLYLVQGTDDPRRKERVAIDNGPERYTTGPTAPDSASAPTHAERKREAARRARIEREDRAWLKLDGQRIEELNRELTQALADFRTAPADARTRYTGRLEHLARALGPRMSDSAKEEFLDLLTSVEPTALRFVIGRCLGRLEGDETIAQRVTQVVLENEGVEPTSLLAATRALGGMQVNSVIPTLLAGIDLDRKERAVLIVQAIGGIGGEAAERGILALLTGREIPRSVRSAAIAAWSKGAPAASYDRVAEALAGAPDYAKEALVSILGRSGDARHTDQVVGVLESTQDRRLKDTAIRTLGRIGDPKAAARLIRIVEEGRPEAKSAERALRDLRSPETLRYVAKSWDALGSEGRRAILRASTRAENPPKEMFALAERSLDDEAVRVRVTAVGALGRKGREAGIKPLANYLSRAQTDREVLAGIQALRRIGTPEAARVALDRLSGMEIRGSLKTYESLLKKQAEG